MAKMLEDVVGLSYTYIVKLEADIEVHRLPAYVDLKAEVKAGRLCEYRDH